MIKYFDKSWRVSDGWSEIKLRNWHKNWRDWFEEEHDAHDFDICGDEETFVAIDEGGVITYWKVFHEWYSLGDVWYFDPCNDYYYEACDPFDVPKVERDWIIPQVRALKRV